MKNNLPVMLLKDLILLPTQEVRLELNNDNSINVINFSLEKNDGHLMIVCPKDNLEESPEVSDLPEIGVIGKIKSKLKLPNGNLRVVISGRKRVKIINYENDLNNNKILKANLMELDLPKFDVVEETAIRRKLLQILDKYINASPYISNSILSSVKGINDLYKLTDVITSFIPFTLEKKLLYMEEINALHRANALIYDLSVELQVIQLDEKIDESLRIEFEQNQKEFVLREKLDAIKKELGENSTKDELICDYLEKINSLVIDEDIRNKFLNEVKKLEYTNEASPEMSILRNYLDLVVSLPWNKYSEDTQDLNEIKEHLDSTHFGLDKVKNRIIEYIAVKKRNKDINSPIICLVGPPGTGKTTLANCIAKSLNKEFYKISVGGLNDSGELIGHRRTYIGANPGKIIQGLKKCNTANPLILIDEVDKMVKDYKGDPASTLLDILDPEQNKIFTDNYVEERFDLSDVLFILTANSIETIPDALYDRLEIIELSSYTQFEKLDITKKYLLPNIYKDHNIKLSNIKFSDDIIYNIINNYTKEAGVRELQRQLSTIIRKIVTNSIKENKEIKRITIKKNDLVTYLGNAKYDMDSNINTYKVGLVNALAVTNCGGIVSPIEACIYRGKGQFTITGMLGQTMHESVIVAGSYIMSNADKYKVQYNIEENHAHIHFLDGAIKKDGPSAGIAIVTSLLSLLLNIEIPTDIAMTGEITLRGDILRVGGIKEKVIGAYNNGIKKIFIPLSNKIDLEEIPLTVKDNIDIILVSNYKEIYNNLFKKTSK